MSSRDRVVFIDEMGEIRPLHGKIDPKIWARAGIEFIEPDSKEAWAPTERPARFVPRRHIQGRPIARFLRAIDSFKITGWIR